MNKDELNERIKILVRSGSNLQKFADLASLEENWSRIDKNITLPRSVGFSELDCPVCFEPVRLIYEKFATLDYRVPIKCPHCKSKLNCVGEFTGYTNEIFLEEV